MKLRLGLVDDHPAVLLGAASVLNAQPDMRVARAGATVSEVLDGGEALDLVLLDLSLADGSSVEDNVAELREAGIPVLAYTGAEQPALLRRAARAGASGAVRKTERAEVIADAVRAVLREGVAAGSDWAAALEHDESFVSARLTDREREVLALYAAGETAERVAAALFISRETVIDHIRRIRAKYAGVDRPAPTKVDLYRRAVEDGLVDEH
ncbi:response regulator transcription factor [Microbacterium sp. RD1]|uniref:helix-turn-helix transcriptional regulator n=1 Tax=Microbacterium sp. RD1 TaxID=3457313 RepID=UPI003FA568F1